MPRVDHRPIEREFRVIVHEEDSSYWAEAAELPGCFRLRADLEELRVAVVEAISLYLSDDTAQSAAPSVSPQGRVEEMQVLISA